MGAWEPIGAVNARMFGTLLFGSKLRLVATAVGLLALVVGGSLAAGIIGTPSVTGVENRVGGVNESKTTIESDLLVSNPNPIGVTLGGTTAEYTIEMNGIEMAHGVKEGVAVERGESSLHFTTAMDNERIPDWWVSHIRNGEHTDLTVDASVHSAALNRSFGAPKVERSVDTDVISQFNSSETRPVNADRPLVSDPVAYINRTNATWGAVTDERTPIDLRFDVHNPKSFPLTVTEIGYVITMNDVQVGEGASERTYVIEPGTTETVETTTAIDNAKLDEWWVTHLRNDQVTALRIDFYARVDLSAVGGGTVEVPLRGLTYEETIETDLFGTKNETAANGTPETETPSDDGDATNEDATAEEPASGTADEPTAAESTPSESTSEETTTEDGGLLAVSGEYLP